MAAIDAAKTGSGGECTVVHLSPQGKRLDQDMLMALAQKERLVLVASRYEGIDERVLETGIDEEISIGDYVLSGGEIPAMVLIDGLTRLLPGALGDDDSAVQDSFYGGLLDFPQYTRPESIDGQEVPPVLLSGNHEEIRRWRLKQSLGRTLERRPDLIRKRELSETEEEISTGNVCPEQLMTTTSSGAIWPSRMSLNNPAKATAVPGSTEIPSISATVRSA